MKALLFLSALLTFQAFAGSKPDCEGRLALSPIQRLLRSAVEQKWIDVADLRLLSRSKTPYNPLNGKPKTPDTVATDRALAKWMTDPSVSWSKEKQRIRHLIEVLEGEAKQTQDSTENTVRLLSVKEVVNRRLEQFARFSNWEQNGARPGLYFEMKNEVYHLTPEEGFREGESIHTIPRETWGKVTQRDKIMMRGKEAFYLGSHVGQESLWTLGDDWLLSGAHTDSAFLNSKNDIFASKHFLDAMDSGVLVYILGRNSEVQEKKFYRQRENNGSQPLNRAGAFYQLGNQVFMAYRWNSTTIKVVCVTNPRIAVQTLETPQPLDQPPRIFKHGSERYLQTFQNLEANRLIVSLYKASRLSEPPRRFVVEGKFLDLNSAQIFTDPLTHRTLFAIPDQSLLHIFDFDKSEALMRVQIPDLTNLHWLETPDQVYFASMDSEVGTRLRIFSLFNERAQ